MLRWTHQKPCTDLAIISIAPYSLGEQRRLGIASSGGGRAPTQCPRCQQRPSGPGPQQSRAAWRRLQWESARTAHGSRRPQKSKGGCTRPQAPVRETHVSFSMCRVRDAEPDQPPSGQCAGPGKHTPDCSQGPLLLPASSSVEWGWPPCGFGAAAAPVLRARQQCCWASRTLSCF